MRHERLGHAHVWPHVRKLREAALFFVGVCWRHSGSEWAAIDGVAVNGERWGGSSRGDGGDGVVDGVVVVGVVAVAVGYL